MKAGTLVHLTRAHSENIGIVESVDLALAYEVYATVGLLPRSA